MNEAHEMCGGAQWRQRMRDRYASVPSVEIVNADTTSLHYQDEKFIGAACFTMLHHVPTNELQDHLCGEVARVPKPAAALVANDSLASNHLRAHHTDDVYNPVDPRELPARLTAAGFVDVEIRTKAVGWAAAARRAG